MGDQPDNRLLEDNVNDFFSPEKAAKSPNQQQLRTSQNKETLDFPGQQQYSRERQNHSVLSAVSSTSVNHQLTQQNPINNNRLSDQLHLPAPYSRNAMSGARGANGQQQFNTQSQQQLNVASPSATKKQ